MSIQARHQVRYRHQVKMSNDTFDGILPEVLKTIRAATSLAAQDVKFYSSLDSELARSIEKSGDALLNIANSLIESSSVDDVEPLTSGSDTASWKPIAEALDSLYEKVDFAFDNVKNSKRSVDQFTYLEDGNQDARAPSKAIQKPQSEFKIKIDNTESGPFKPKISTKPNAVKSFEESTKLILGDDNEEEPPHYDHPYDYEIDNQPYPDSILVADEPIPSKSWNETSAIWVDTVPKLNEMIKSLQGSSAIAVDLEHHDYRTYYGLVCLMQISNREQDWIVDTLKLRDDLEPLNIVFTDPQVIKVFHGAFMDIIWLQRDLGLYVVSLFDTYHASKKLGFPKFSLAYLLETFSNFKTSKKYQLADWRSRPLSAPMMAYARSDTHFLLNIFDQLRNKLIAKGDGRLQEVLFESRQVAKRRFEYTKYRPLNASGGNVTCPVMSSNPKEPYGNIMAQYRVSYHKMPLVRALYEWRDALAKEEDESVRYIMPNQLLVSLALLSSPVDSQKVLGSSNFISDSVRIHAREVAALIETTLKDMDESDWELVDKLSDTVGNDSAFINDDKPDTSVIQLTSKAFERLSSEVEQENNTEGNSDLLNTKSFLLSEILDKEKDQFSVEYDTISNSLIKHSMVETKSRLKTLLNHLRTATEVVIATSPSEVQDSIVEPEVVAQETQSDNAPSEVEDKDELVTIRNKIHSKKPTAKSQKSDSPDEPSFDYANADKIMLEANKRRDKRDKNKKRSFDPYANSGDGPQAAKKTKRVNSGKTSTFAKKKR